MEAQIEWFTNHLGGWWWVIALLLVMAVFRLKDVVWKRTHSKSGTTGYKKLFRLSIMGHAILFTATVIVSFAVFDFGADIVWLRKEWVATCMFLTGAAVGAAGWQKHDTTNHSKHTIASFGMAVLAVHWILAILVLATW